MMTSFVACVSMPIGSRPDLGPSSSSVALQTHFKAIALVELASRVGDDFVARVAGLFGDLPCQMCGTTQPLVEAAPTRCLNCNKTRGM